jgi:hypothetical protein
MVRAPTLAECPRCRGAPPRELAEPALLDAGATPSLTGLASRLFLASVPLAWIALFFWVATPSREPRTLSYAELGWVSTALALTVGAIVAVLGTLALSRLAARVSIGGETAHPLAIAACMIFAVAPFAAVPTYQGIESLNQSGLASQPAEEAECRWTEARQQISQRSGAVLHVTVHAICTLPSGRGLELDIPLESARVVEGERLVVPTWRGRGYGRLVAIPAR